MTRDDALDKLRKLRKLAEGAGTPEEAQAALTQGARIATKFSISDGEIETDDVMFTVLQRYGGLTRATETLLFHVCQMCGCYPVTRDGDVVVYGRPADREIAKILVLASIDTVEEQYWQTRQRYPRTKMGPFAEAFIQVLLARMTEAQNEVLDSIQTRALAVITPKHRALNIAKECADTMDLKLNKPKRAPKDDVVSRARGAGAAADVKLPGEHEAIGE